MEATSNVNPSQQNEQISLKEAIQRVREFYQYLLTKWRIIFFAGIIGAALGFTYAYLRDPVYTAECTFVLEDAAVNTGLGQYAGIASMVGIDLAGGGGNGIFQGENIIELYKSRTMIEKTLLTKAKFNGSTGLLIDRFIQFNQLREAWKKKPGLSGIRFTIPPEKFTLQHDSIMREIVKDINKNYLTVKKPDNKLGVISVTVKARDELFAKAFTDKIVENVNEFYIQTRTKKSTKNLTLLQKQADSVRQVLNLSLGGIAASIDANPNANPALQMLRVPSQRRQVDVQASSAIYAEVVKNLELARISLRNETPLIQVIDGPKLPLEEEEIGKIAGAVVGCILTTSLVVIYLLIRRIIQLL